MIGPCLSQRRPEWVFFHVIVEGAGELGPFVFFVFSFTPSLIFTVLKKISCNTNSLPGV